MGLAEKFFSNARKPAGLLGKIMIAGMNIFHAPVAHWGMSHLNIPEPADIAELGCGGGKNITDLLRKYPYSHVTGLDYSPLSLEKACKHNRKYIASGRCELVEGDVSALKFDDEKFDLATAFETIYFWPGLVRCFGEVRRILKDGGHFLIVSESDGQDSPSMWFKKHIDGMNTYPPPGNRVRTTLRRLQEHQERTSPKILMDSHHRRKVGTKIPGHTFTAGKCITA